MFNVEALPAVLVPPVGVRIIIFPTSTTPYCVTLLNFRISLLLERRILLLPMDESQPETSSRIVLPPIKCDQSEIDAASNGTSSSGISCSVSEKYIPYLNPADAPV
jgi:hypothetical protein